MACFTEGNVCPVEFAVDLISGKWKVLVIWELRITRRFNELERLLPGVKRKVLIQQLKELEQDRIITRKVYPQVPPKVEYSLTESGKGLLRVFSSLSDWAGEHMNLLKQKASEV